MRKSFVLKIVTVVFMILLVCGFAKLSFAATQTITALNSIENDTVGNGSNNTVNNITANEPANNTVENNTLTNNVPVNNTPVNNTAIPETGAKSNVGLFTLMGIFSVSAVYTFVKIKKYEI